MRTRPVRVTARDRSLDASFARLDSALCSSAVMSTQNATPEMGRFLRQIVENYLEEGQFEGGIAILDQMRSPDHKPSMCAVSYFFQPESALTQ